MAPITFRPLLDGIPTGRHHESGTVHLPVGATMSPDHPPGLDLDRLRGLLDRERPGLVTGPLSGRLIEGGRSNLTYAVSTVPRAGSYDDPSLGHVLGHRARHEARAPCHQRPAPDGRTGCRARSSSARTRRSSGRPSTSWSSSRAPRTAPPTSSPRSAPSAPGPPC
ncbi:hypothetical protein LV779_09330 [Streptomyces thinghirensis]|nr:hypothetical protein [Streptomyces thinghirensis]